jgi:hypothetical protein
VSVHKNCTLTGKAYDTQRIADFVAREVVPGQLRHMRVPKYSSVHTCLFSEQLSNDLSTGIFTAIVCALISSLLLYALIMTTYWWVRGVYEKRRSVVSERMVFGSQVTEMTATSRSSGPQAYAAVPMDDASAHGGGSVSAQVLQPDGDEQYVHILV